MKKLGNLFEILLNAISQNPVTYLLNKCKRKNAANESKKFADQSEIEDADTESKEEEEEEEVKNFDIGIIQFMLKPSTLKRFVYFSQGNHLSLVIYHFSCFLSTYLEAIIPISFAKCIDILKSKEENAEEKIYHQIFLFIGISLFSSTVTFFSKYIDQKTYRKNEADVQVKVFDGLLSKDLHFFENINSQGSLLSNVLSKYYTITTYGMFEPYIKFLQDLMHVLMTFGILWSTSWKLSLSICIIMPLFSIATTMFSNCHDKLLDKFWDGHDEKTQIISECVSNIRVVKAFSTEKKSVGILRRNLQSSTQLVNKLSLIQGCYYGFIDLCGQVGEIIVLLVGGALVMKGQLSIGELSMALMYARTFSDKASGLSEFFTKLSKDGVELKRIFNLLDYVPVIKASGGKCPDTFEGNLKFDNVTFCYPGRPNAKVLKNISLEIKPGEVVAFAGASGSGKSSIISLINRFFDPTQGSLLIDGEDLKALDLEWFHKHIGYVSQEPVLMAGTIAENIAYGVDSYTPEQMDAVIDQANIREFVEKKELFPKGLDTEVGEKGVKLSGGQKQRVAIARALMKSPKILIFDEATSALDAESEHQVQKAIDELMMQQGGQGKRTMIVIAHRLSTIINSQKIFVMKDGEVQGVGSHQYLMSKGGIYKELFERQLAGYDGQRRGGEGEEEEEKEEEEKGSEQSESESESD